MGQISDEDIFYCDYDWFIGHVKSLAMSPDDCVANQAGYNVAHELWYFIPQCGHLLRDPLRILNQDQKASIQELVRVVEAIPEDARKWTTVVQESVKNLRHDAWIPARMQAQRVLVDLKPLAQLREQYYSGS